LHHADRGDRLIVIEALNAQRQEPDSGRDGRDRRHRDEIGAGADPSAEALRIEIGRPAERTGVVASGQDVAWPR
jgi:hypothetical protein